MNYSTFSLTFFLLFGFIGLKAQCPTSNVTMTTQAEVDQFLTDYPNCTTIVGGVVLEINDDGTDPITSLAALSNITSTTGALRILNTTLTDFSGLNNITSITNTLLLQDNSGITSTAAFANLVTVNSIYLASNSNLANCDDFCHFIGGPTIDIGSNTGTCQSTNAFLAACALLPIELSSFEATLAGHTVLLSWETLSETNNRGFSIEKSTNGKDWTTLGWVDGSDTDRTANQYEFTDYTPASKANYYRLKQIDFDGQFEYSPVVNAYMPVVPTTYVYPNPVKDVIYIGGVTGDETPISSIYNALGQKVFQANTNEILVSQLPTGIYTIHIQLNGEIQRERFIIE